MEHEMEQRHLNQELNVERNSL